MSTRRNKPSLAPLPLLVVAGLGMGLGGVGGCVAPDQPEIAAKVVAPVAYDEAMALRDWPLTTATYASGDVVAGPTNKTWEYDTTNLSERPSARRRTLAQVAESAVFVGNVLVLPVQLVRNPPTENRRYEGIDIPPTYSAAVPVPGAEGIREQEAEPVTKPVLEGSVVPATPDAVEPSMDAATGPATRPATGPSTRPSMRRSSGARS